MRSLTLAARDMDGRISYLRDPWTGNVGLIGDLELAQEVAVYMRLNGAYEVAITVPPSGQTLTHLADVVDAAFAADVLLRELRPHAAA